jgi:hypothetical protein
MGRGILNLFSVNLIHIVVFPAAIGSVFREFSIGPDIGKWITSWKSIRKPGVYLTENIDWNEVMTAGYEVECYYIDPGIDDVNAIRKPWQARLGNRGMVGLKRKGIRIIHDDSDPYDTIERIEYEIMAKEWTNMTLKYQEVNDQYVEESVHANKELEHDTSTVNLGSSTILRRSLKGMIWGGYKPRPVSTIRRQEMNVSGSILEKSISGQGKEWHYVVNIQLDQGLVVSKKTRWK